jgi:hypothetical protein
MAKTPAVEVRETEEELIVTAQGAVSRCNWVVGECAAKWTRKYAKGRTDADFAESVGLSGDQVFQRRRVWETFGDVYENYPELKWSHFYVALNWDDAPECLQWAEENEATVSEMRAWRRALRGEDLTEPPIDEWGGGDATVSFVPNEPTVVRNPASAAGGERERAASGKAVGGRVTGGAGGETADRLAAVARDSERSEGEYAPFRRGAGSPAPTAVAEDVAVADKPQPPVEQIVKRMTATLERFNKLFTPEMAKQFRRLPEKDRQRFLKAAAELSLKVTELL